MLAGSKLQNQKLWEIRRFFLEKYQSIE